MHCEWVVLVDLAGFDEPVTRPSTRSPEVPGCSCRTATAVIQRRRRCLARPRLRCCTIAGIQGCRPAAAAIQRHCGCPARPYVGRVFPGDARRSCELATAPGKVRVIEELIEQ